MFDDKKIRAAFIVEVLGRPPEHLTETLNGIIKNISEEKEITVTEKKVNSPAEVKDQKNLYTAFAEIEIETEKVIRLAQLVFKYMPSHVEVISPETHTIKNHELSEFLSELTKRLHFYDKLTGSIEFEKQVLEKQLRMVLERQKLNPLEKAEESAEKPKAIKAKGSKKKSK